MANPHILCIDGMNFLHRARSGWQLGPAPVVFNFMRNLRALVEQMKPSRVYLVMEGHPQQRIDMLPEYKANRAKVDATPEEKELDRRFYEQVDEIVGLLQNMPVTVVRHPRFECDDTIYNIIKRASSAVPWTVVSNDSDFTQLLNEFPNVRLYNPMKKEYVEAPDYDYVTWKALRGDGSDNIPGIPGVGDKTAEDLLNDPQRLGEVLHVPENGETFVRNIKLIKFIDWSDDDALEMTSSAPERDWEPLRTTFERYEFKSLLKESTWAKFIGTFDPLFG